jgi:hypothetical protein
LPFRILIGNVVADKMKNEPARQLTGLRKRIRTIEGGDE